MYLSWVTGRQQRCKGMHRNAKECKRCISLFFSSSSPGLRKLLGEGSQGVPGIGQPVEQIPEI